MSLSSKLGFFLWERHLAAIIETESLSHKNRNFFPVKCDLRHEALCRERKPTRSMEIG